MQIYGPTHVHGAQSIQGPHQARPTQIDSRPSGISTTDELEISDAARLTEQAKELPDIRQEKVQSIRASIEAGTYDSADKLDAALERLLDEIA